MANVRREVPVAVTELKYICGLRVSRDVSLGVMYVDQTEYIENKAAVFGITSDGFAYKTPMEENFKLGQQPTEADPELVTLVLFFDICCAHSNILAHTTQISL